jgi:hypothetical protein
VEVQEKGLEKTTSDPRNSEIAKTAKTRRARRDSKAIGCEQDQKFRRE